MTWTIVLAGGSGTRLAEVSRRRYGYARPKQFCDYDGGGTLLDRALDRARRHSVDARIVVVTTRAHRFEAEQALAAHPEVVWLEQPRGLDTTPGILAPLLHVRAADPDAEVVLLPADHHVLDERVFAGAVRRGLDVARAAPGTLAVLGAEPAGSVEDYGWLVPSSAEPGARVLSFREKPAAAELDALRRAGAVVNTLVLVGSARAFASSIAAHCPGWWRALRAAGADADRIEAAYDVLPASNFSRDVLENVTDRLRIVVVPATAGWSDVGTPARLEDAFGEGARRAPGRARVRERRWVVEADRDASHGGGGLSWRHGSLVGMVTGDDLP